jgi:predicted phage terminase large subunit-like protein
MAVSKGEKADYTVIGTVGLDEAGQMYLLNVVRDRFDPDECTTEIFKLEKMSHPAMIFVEKGLLKNVIQPLLTKDMSKKKSYPTLEPVYAPGDKRTKARAIQKIMRGGGLYVDKQAEWYPAFEDEMLRFDRAAHDDQVDMMALFGLRFDDMVNAPTQEETENDEWEEDHSDQPTGRNKVTGY